MSSVPLLRRPDWPKEDLDLEFRAPLIILPDHYDPCGRLSSASWFPYQRRRAERSHCLHLRRFRELLGSARSDDLDYPVSPTSHYLASKANESVYSPEVFTTELRAKANALVQVIHYSISLVITQCSPIALAAVGWKYYVCHPQYSLRYTTNATDRSCLS